MVDFALDPIGIRPFPWQRWLYIHGLETVNGMFRYRTVLVLVARQNGKTFAVEVKNLWKLFVLGVPLVIGTAHNLEVSEESWEKAIEFIEGTPELSGELVSVTRGNAKKSFKLANGSRWKVTTASRRARGLSGDDVNLDELREHQNWLAWGAVTKTTMARDKAQIWAFSNAGDNTSVVLNSLQKQGRAAAKAPATADQTMGFFEWSAPDDVRCSCGRRQEEPHAVDCVLLSPQVLAKPNPSLGYPGGVSVTALRAAANTDPDEVFLTECLCVSVPDLAGRIIDPSRWADMADPQSRREGDVALAIDIEPERDWAAIGLYGKRADGLGHLQLLDWQPGVDWIVPRLVRLRAELDPIAVGMGRGTYASLREPLKRAGFIQPSDRPAVKSGEDTYPFQRGDIVVMGGPAMAAACGQLIDAVRETADRHVPAPPLMDAVAGARTRSVGDTLTWSRKTSNARVAPLVSVTAARWTYHDRFEATRMSDYDPSADFW